MPHTPTISHHVVERWRERVDPAASRCEAHLAVGQMLALGRYRATPRHWMPDDAAGPGKLFVYWSGKPGTCILVVNGVAVTVVTRVLARATREIRLKVIAARHGTAPKRARLRPVEPWRWDGDLGEAA